MKVHVIEFRIPNGAQIDHFVEVPNDCAVGYEALRRHKCRLTAERLSTGHISQCIEHEEGDYDIEITPNGPEAIDALVKMIRSFKGEEFEKWINEREK